MTIDALNEKKAKAKLKWSIQAQALLEQLDDSFDIEEFEKFVQDRFFTVGSTYILEYLHHKKTQALEKGSA